MKELCDMTLQERREYIEQKALSITYGKVNDKLKQVLKELKGYEEIFIIRI